MTVTNLTAPVVSGDVVAGDLLATSNGTWDTDTPPLAYTYRWLRCDAAGDNCVAISGQVASTYRVRDADVASTIRSEVTATEVALPFPPISTGESGTGTHWADPSEYDTLAEIGYTFAVTVFAPADIAGATAKLDAAQAAGIQLIIGLYSFGGPEPYSLSGDTWTLSAAAINAINFLESRSDDVLAFFGFNEPLWIHPITGTSSSCGSLSATQLRNFRTAIRAHWPAAPIYHDLGEPEAWAPGGFLHDSYPCIGNKYADMSDVCDYAGIWFYPFTTGGYLEAEGRARINIDAPFVVSEMGAVPVFLGQSHSAASDGLVYPSLAQIADWNIAMREELPTGSLISWYVWRQDLYPDYLVNHPEQWDSTVP